jgi:uncharacterized membrane protein YfcA
MSEHTDVIGARRLLLWLEAAACFAVCAVAVLDVAWVISGRVRWEGLLFGIPGALVFGVLGARLARRG